MSNGGGANPQTGGGKQPDAGSGAYPFQSSGVPPATYAPLAGAPNAFQNAFAPRPMASMPQGGAGSGAYPFQSGSMPPAGAAPLAGAPNAFQNAFAPRPMAPMPQGAAGMMGQQPPQAQALSGAPNAFQNAFAPHPLSPIPQGATGMMGQQPPQAQALSGAYNVFQNSNPFAARPMAPMPQGAYGMAGQQQQMQPIGIQRPMGSSPFGQQQIGPPPPRAMAQGLQGLGRGTDSTMVHMSPQEVGGLQQLAQRFGGSLTQNPHTGLPEAGFLSSILPMVAGGVLAATGIGAPAAAAIVAAEEGIRQKDWKRGLMAGLGAYGGAGLGGALGSAGAASGAAGTAANTAGGLTELNASNLSALGSAGATGATGAGMAAPGLASNVAEAGTNASTAVNPAIARASWDQGGFQNSMSNMGRGIQGLNNKQAISSLGSQVGKMGVAEMAAPAMYDAMNPTPIKQTPTPPPKYWVPQHGYNSLYNAQTHRFNPGVFSTNFPGMADGGTVESYQRMMNTPNTAMAPPPPPPTAMNNYLADLQKQATTYTPPSVAAPMDPQFKSVPLPNMGQTGNPHFPPGSHFWGVDLNKLTTPAGGVNTQPVDGHNPYAYMFNNYRGARRAGGGLVSLLDGGHVDGPGDGVSDSVPATIDGSQPAALAKGEFVIPARIVSELGNGSTEAGSQRLYDMMHRIERARRSVPMSGDSGAYKKLPV